MLLVVLELRVLRVLLGWLLLVLSVPNKRSGAVPERAPWQQRPVRQAAIATGIRRRSGMRLCTATAGGACK